MSISYQPSRFNLSEWALTHRALTLFFMLLLTAGGLFAYATLGLKEEPEFKFKMMVLRVVWPGATAQEIEQQVTDKIELRLQDTPNLDYLRSYSKPGESVVFVSLRGATRSEDVDETWYQVRKKVADIQATLPAGTSGPFFNDEFGDTYANIYAVSGDGFAYADIKRYADLLRADLLRVEGVEKTDVLGVQDEKIYIEFSHKKLATLGIDPQQLVALLRAQNQMGSAGRVNTSETNIAVRVSGSFASVDAIENTAIRVNGHAFRLGDIADVKRGYVDPPESKMRHQGKEVIGVAITTRRGFDVTKLGNAVDARVNTLRAKLPVGIEIATVANQPEVVRRSAGEFNRSLAEAVIIVLIVSFVSLGLRTGLVVALTIPIVLALTFLGMKLAGIELHRISFGALIIALGLLVDDAMIAVEMMARKLEEGFDKLRAASFAYDSTAFPMLTGTLITAAAFAPIGLSKGAASEYTSAIFWVTAMALLISWVVAITLTPYLGSLILKEKKSVGTHHDIYDGRFYQIFRRVVNACIEHRWKTIGVTAAAFVVAMLAFTLVPKQFFPNSNRPEMVISLRLPEDASFTASEAAAARVEALLQNDAEVRQYTTYIGQATPRFYLSLNQEEFSSPNYTEIVAIAQDS
ncbi:MAG: efflux RND transporter permease subunit, partial [Gammaproteobacteria bacterium]|nr:efflux RND transporter permease subunit [Gammaproteobacteria bacterium]